MWNLGPEHMKQMESIAHNFIIAKKVLAKINTIYDEAKLIKWIIILERWPLRAHWLILMCQEFEESFYSNSMQTETLESIYKRCVKNLICDRDWLFKAVDKISTKRWQTIFRLDHDSNSFDKYIHEEPQLQWTDISPSDTKSFFAVSFNFNYAIWSEIYNLVAIHVPASSSTTLTAQEQNWNPLYRTKAEKYSL